MPRRAAAILITLALTACGTQPLERTSTKTQRLAHPLPDRGHLTTRAHAIKGPRVMTERTHGRTITMYGASNAKTRLLIAGCANGTTCAGTDVVNAALMGCPPPDAELWYFQTLQPDNADLDADPTHPGAQAFRQAAADLRPTTAIVFRTGPQTRVTAAGRSATTARRFARLANLPFTHEAAQGLAPWTATALPGTAAITVELPPGRVSARRAVRLAYAIERLAGTRFAQGAYEDRRRMIAFGGDPRESWH